MGVFKTITYIAGAITCGLAGYLYKIVQESDYLQSVAEVPKDDILGFHIVAGVILAWLLFSLIFKVVSRTFVLGLLAFVILVEGSFIGLNVKGVVIEQQASLQEQLLNKGKELVEELKDLTSG